MKKLSLFIACLLTGVFAVSAVQQTPAAGRPKLVLAIVVDQLRTDRLEQLRPLLGENGMKKLMTQGAYLKDVRFSPAKLDKASSTAMLFTGATPDKTGIASAYRYSPKSLRREASLTDPSAMGNFTNDTYSPRNLLLSTISDEVMIDGGGLGLVYAVSTDPQQAIIMAGHAGSGALWLDHNSGKWSTTTYYGDMPQIASNRNYRFPLSSRIDTMQWKPLLPLERYPGIPAQKRYYDFRHTFPSSQRDVYTRFAESPKGNREVTDMAVDYLKSLKMGSRGNTIDMLCVGLSAAPYKYVKDGDYRLELADTYLRLDKDITRLLQAAESNVGAGNYIVMLVSTGYYDDATPDDPKFKIPTGEFSVKRAQSLLNTYLSGQYGQGEYVPAYCDGRFYLNQSLIESKKRTVAEVALLAKEFLSKMSGVDRVYTLSDLLSSSSPEEEAWRLSTDPRSGADLIVEIMPGWVLVDDSAYPESRIPIRRTRYNAPALFYGTSVTPGIHAAPVDATSIAPTLTGLIGLRAPNGAASHPAL